MCLAGLRQARKSGAARYVPYPDWAGVNEDLLVQLFESIASKVDGRALVRVGGRGLTLSSLSRQLYQNDAPAGRQRPTRRRVVTAMRLMRACGGEGGAPPPRSALLFFCDWTHAWGSVPLGHCRRPRLPLLACLRPGGASP
jgi:hypothetical protein